MGRVGSKKLSMKHLVLDVVCKAVLVCRFHKVLSFLRDVDPTSQCTTYPHCSCWAESGKVDWSKLEIENHFGMVGSLKHGKFY